MFALLSIATLALTTASSVHSIVVPRASHPPGWLTNVLEPYETYHQRYLAIGCKEQHGKPFFDQCCHPLLATEKLEEHRPAQCIPKPDAPSAADKNASDDDEDCEGEYEGDNANPADSTSTSEPAPEANPPPSNPAPAPPKPTTKAPPPPAPAPPAPAPAPPKPAPAPPAPAPPKAPSNGGGGVFSGFATFFFQNGVAGACGTPHSDGALIAAISTQRYGNTGQRSGLCGQKVKITNPANGKNVVVSIEDACPGCDGPNSIDLSTGAFNAIANPSQGKVPISWSFL